MRRATPEDIPALERFLRAHADSSMFLRSNLAAHGIGASQHRHATDVALWETSPGVVRGAVGLTRGGFLMAQCPEPDGPDLTALPALWQGRTVLGMTGLSEQVDRVLAALGLAGQPLQLDAPEPLYALDLTDLPALEGEIRAPTERDAARLRLWFRDYALETGQSADRHAAAQEAETRAAQVIAEPQDLRLLVEHGAPVAMTGFNAVLPDMVQVGGVYVPPGQRGRRYARRAVGLHLAKARAAGVRRAILFAASPQAARAYEGLGFQRVGTYRIRLFATPQQIGAA